MVEDKNGYLTLLERVNILEVDYKLLTSFSPPLIVRQKKSYGGQKEKFVEVTLTDIYQEETDNNERVLFRSDVARISSGTLSYVT